jgi:transcriptional regulator with GAF, ATPase, and Fis domain
MVARLLHRLSPRSKGPFVAVNCSALPEALIESELFGHRKGAFTGAHEDTLGKFRLAHGGTIFLDEIGDMPLDVQTRLLRVLQEKTVSPVGDHREIPVDFRLICATHRHLRRAVIDGLFREDLYYRLNVVQIKIPPLRERPMDIPLLIQYFLLALIPPPEAEAVALTIPNTLLSLPFPGNIRELRNLVERYVVMRQLGWSWFEAIESQEESENRQIQPESHSLPESGLNPASPVRNSRVSDTEILGALATCGHHRAKTSTLLGISRRALQYRLAKMASV